MDKLLQHWVVFNLPDTLQTTLRLLTWFIIETIHKKFRNIRLYKAVDTSGSDLIAL